MRGHGGRNASAFNFGAGKGAIGVGGSAQKMLIRYAAHPNVTFAETAGLFVLPRLNHRTAEAGALT